MSEAQTQHTAERKYRPEIDGLRAFAVVAVIINHFNKDILPGGYLGVDIFFVISGYVITLSILSKNITSKSEFIKEFAARRVKRLLPALITCVIVTSILYSLFNPYPGEGLIAGITALFGASNFYFYYNSFDYWGNSLAFNPFTQTWSLGVEEQFYLIFPALVSLGANSSENRFNKNRLLWVIILLSAASFASFVHFSQSDQPAAYFLPTSRFWEIGLGVCLAIIEKDIFQYRRSITNSALTKYISTIILLLLIIIFALIDDKLFPLGIPITTLSTIGLLITLSSRSHIKHVLSSTPLVFIGKISYSLYLWHWSILVLGRITIGIHAFLIIPIIAASCLSYFTIEEPFRRNPWSKKSTNDILIGLTANAFVAITIIFIQKGLPGTGLYLGSKLTSKDNSNSTSVKTHIMQPKDLDKGYFSQNKGIFFIGDSHSGNFSRISDLIFQDTAKKIHIIHEGGAPFPPISHILLPGRSSAYNRNATSLQDKVFKEILKDPPRNSIVVVSNYLTSWLGRQEYLTNTNARNATRSYLDNDGNNISYAKSLIAYRDKLDRVHKKLSEANSTLIVVLPGPDFNFELTPNYLCTKEWFRPSPPQNSCAASSRTSNLEDQKKLREDILETLGLYGNEHAEYKIINPLNLFCDNNNSTCTNKDDSGKLLFRDSNHLSSAGLQLLWERLLKRKVLESID